jgi:NADPH-dependent 2,4-dienoyl-CoA reductase/sulfur reductase-like enzyme/nitrite reductase/ring-hydroxylating ferredoxin subunit
MAEENSAPLGPDLEKGIALNELADGGMLTGHVGGDAVLLARRGPDIFALDAHCSHYHAPLADGLMVGDTLRCPWHHACFDLRTGEALRAPALSPLSCWKVEQKGGRVFVREKLPEAKPKAIAGAAAQKIVIIGGGAAGFAAAEMLRRIQYQGQIVMLSDEAAAPVDRPNLSKDYLAGSAPEEWVPMRAADFYTENKIDLRLGVKVTGVDPKAHTVTLTNGTALSYDRLLLATGAEAIRPAFPGSDLPHVHTLRNLDDCRAIIVAARSAEHVVVVGASFIGLEVAASLRTRGLEVHVVAPEARPMERILGPQMGDVIRALHEEHGVNFHLGESLSEIEAGRVKLKSGATLDSDLVILGVGVKPRTQLAEAAGLAMDRGVTVNEFLQTSASDIFAAGDIARWPDRHGGEAIRVEHWVVAQRQGQTAALNMLGARGAFTSVPFFWSQHYDMRINYVGHAEKWDDIVVEGDIAAKDCLLRFKRAGRDLAVASIFRDVDSLKAERDMENA